MSEQAVSLMNTGASLEAGIIFATFLLFIILLILALIEAVVREVLDPISDNTLPGNPSNWILRSLLDNVALSSATG